MAYITLPQTERTKSGLEAFSEAFTPGLERAFHLALQRKMEEEQYRKTMERNKQMFPELFQEQITPQGYEQLKPFMRGIDQGGNISPEVALKEAEGRATQKGKTIPKQYQFNREALQPGMQVKFDEKGLPQFGYDKPITTTQPVYLVDPTTGGMKTINPATGALETTIAPPPKGSKIITTKEEKPLISATAALNVLSDPVKAQQFKQQYPELYPALEQLASNALGGESSIPVQDESIQDLVTVLNPKGQKTRIKRTQLSEALKQNYKLP